MVYAPAALYPKLRVQVGRTLVDAELWTDDERA